jgi:thiol-disulfide isomerase/thioredoxin
MYTVLKVINSKASFAHMLQVISRWALILLFLCIQTFAYEEKDQPDLFFGVDALAIEESGVSKWLEKKYPDFREWAKEWGEDINQSNEFYEAMDLLEEDFSKIEFVMSGLDYWLNNKTNAKSIGQEIGFSLGLAAGKPMNLTKFYRWVNEKMQKEFGPHYSRKILSPPILTSDHLEFSINLSDANHSGLDNQSILFDANLSVSADIVDDSSVIIAAVPASMKEFCFAGQSDFNFSISSELPDDRQITLLLKVPVDEIPVPNPGGASQMNPFLDAVDGVRELACSVSFRDDSILIKTIVLCADTQRASAMVSLWQGSVGMAQLVLAQDPTARPFVNLLGNMKTECLDEKFVISMEMNSSSIGAIFAQTLNELDPPPLRIPKKEFQLLEGKIAPIFTTPLIDGAEFDLSTQRGKIVVLDFWATWCGPCIRGLPMLLETVSEFDESEVVLMAVNQGETVSEVKEFIDHFDLVDLTVALDEKKRVGSLYDVKGMPHTVVIDAAGFVRDVSVGFSPFQGTDLKRLLGKLLQEK